MVYLGQPAQVEKHVLQDGLPDDYDPAQLFLNVFTKKLHLSRSAYPDLVDGEYLDVEIIEAQEMLDSIDDKFSWSGKYVCLDLDNDAVDPDEFPLQPSGDVDSLNWITPLIRTRLTVQLMLTPAIQKWPPSERATMSPSRYWSH
jgi:hypothetical protein